MSTSPAALQTQAGSTPRYPAHSGHSGKTHPQEGPQGGNARAFPVGTAVCGLLVCRLNFTLSHLDVTCEAYDHFRACLRQLEQLQDGQLRFAVEPVEASFPQRLEYERIRQLVGALEGAVESATCSL